MLDLLKSDKKFRVLAGIMMASIIVALWTIMTIYQAAPREVIVLVIAAGIIYALTREVKKYSSKSIESKKPPVKTRNLKQKEKLTLEERLSEMEEKIG